MINCQSIVEKKCTLEEWGKIHGYYEIDNEVKYSIAHHPEENCLYAKGSHFGWTKVDSNDLIDYPSKRIELARKQVGHEIMLTAGGHRKSKESSLKSSVDDDSIPAKFQQS